MIDFRYHLVTIVSVFLALTVGIVLGTTALRGPIQDTLSSNVTRLSSDKQGLQGNLVQLQGQVRTADRFALAVAPTLVRGSLADQRVLLVTTPQTPQAVVDAVTPLLTSAGASLTGQLRVLPALSAPASRQLVDDLVAKVVPAGLTLPTGDPVERAGAELAAAFAVPPVGKGIAADAAQAVVSSFQEADLVQYVPQGPGMTRATLALVLGGASLRDPAQQSALLALTAALDDRSSGTVVAAPAGASGSGGLLTALGKDSGLAAGVSTVDNADQGIGQVAIVMALAEQARGRTGAYGTGPDTAGPLPGSGPS